MKADTDSSICWGWTVRDWVDSCSSWSMIISTMRESGLECDQSIRSVFGSKGVSVEAVIGQFRGGER